MMVFAMMGCVSPSDLVGRFEDVGRMQTLSNVVRDRQERGPRHEDAIVGN